jgi:hypothetical protein
VARAAGQARRERPRLTAPPRKLGGVLLLYRRPISGWFRDALTIEDHIAAFDRHSRFEVSAHNTELGYPRGLEGVRFGAIVLHYSLFGGGAEEYPFPPRFSRYLDQSPDAYKVAFFHDEHVFCGQRFDYLNQHRFDCVFTLLEPKQFEQVYGAHTNVPKLVTHLPGYVGPSALDAAARFQVPDAERPIDVGFRARPLAPYMGEDEKTEIGEGFARRAAATGLALDIEVSAESLLPGDDWYRFLARCKTTLGVESGTSCFDLEDEVHAEYSRLVSERGAENVTVDDLRGGALDRWEDRVYYRTIGPRHFEAAAMRVTQVLFEGHYSGLMEPMRHYISLKKDFSNFDQVVEQIREPEVRRELAENAHRDLIASGEHTYASLIGQFDAVLAEAGLKPESSEADREAAGRALRRNPISLAAQRLRSTLSYHPVLSRLLWRISRPVLSTYRRLRRAWLERGSRGAERPSR